MNKTVLFLFAILGLAFTGRAQNWPREFTSSQGKVVLYQPQPQKMDGNRVTGVMAFSLLPNGQKEPKFGAMNYDARLNIDRDTRTYRLESLAIPNLKFSGENKDLDTAKIKAAIIKDLQGWEVVGSLDGLMASLENYQTESKENQRFNNAPPTFIYKNTPHVLILVDGEPKFQDIKNSDLRHLANTGYVILQTKSDKKYYLFGGEVWYVTNDLKGQWQVTKNIPGDIKKLLEANKEAAKSAPKVEGDKNAPPPSIIVATSPTELIQTKGEPAWKKIDSTSIEFAENTEDNIFRSGGSFYVLKSGRWFKSGSLNSGWVYLPAEELSKEFAKIQSGSEKDIVLASIPGTVESRDALLDAQLPQTATVDRKTGGKDKKVEYDGAPQYERIEGTNLDLVKNADKTVFRTTAPAPSGSGAAAADAPKYYMVDNGIWYASSSPDGPWFVSDNRPQGVDNIPPSSSAYNTKYVYVYDATPDVVYVGYTPGYMGSYIYGPTVVYGTGFYYQPWYGSMYYPHHTTWGFNMNYNPWTGWSIGFGFTTGPFHFGFGTGGFSFGMSWGFGGPMWGYPSYGYGYFGPPMYRPPCFNPHYPWYGYNRPGYGGGGGNRPINSPGGGNINWGGGNQINVGGDVNINIGNNVASGNNLYNKAKANDRSISSGVGNRDVSKMDMGGRPGAGNANKGGAGNARPAPGGNVRPDAGNNARPAPGGALPNDRPSKDMGRPSSQPNNVFADKNGNVYQKDKTGNIQQNTGGNNWGKPSTPVTNDRMPSTMDNRDRGSNKANNFNQMSRPSTSPMPSTRPAPAPAARPAPAGVGRKN
jgi:hypothetical protein